MDFLEELKRRKVVRVAIGYALVAWATVQVAATSFPLLKVPERWATVVLIVAIAGFPVAIVLAWAFDLSPDGVRRTRSGDAPARPWPVAVRAGATGAVMLVVAAGAFATVRRIAQPERNTVRTIAVLPFHSVGNDPAQQSFSDGVSEQLLNDLARIDGLSVIARTSSFEFRAESAAAEAQQKLDADAVLTGSVQREGQNLRVTARLIDAGSGRVIWTDQYDQVISSLMELQDQITSAIVGALDLRIASALHSGGTSNAEALQAYFNGLTLWHKRGAPSLKQAAVQFENATRLDPKYAQAWAGLALTYAVFPLFGLPNADSIGQLAKAAAQRALDLAPDLPEAHAAVSQIALNFDLDVATAERESARAIELRPSYATAHQWHAEALQVRRRVPEARAALERALALDPRSGAARNIMSHQLMIEGKTDSAVAYTRETMRMLPDVDNAGSILMLALLAAERYEQADSFVRGADAPMMHIAMEGAIAARAGRRATPEYTRALAVLAALEKQNPAVASILAASLRQDDRALRMLAQDAENKDAGTLYRINWPGFDRLRNRPEFQAILRKLGAIE